MYKILLDHSKRLQLLTFPKVHSVEKKHEGREHSSVFYIPAGPDCRKNRSYLRRMRHAFATGRTPPDFPPNNFETDYTGRADMADVSAIGREMMGWEEEEEVGVGSFKETSQCPRP